MKYPVKTKSDLIERIIANSVRIKQFGVKQIGLFGSFVHDNANETSDVDFYVDFYEGKKNFDNFMELAELLEDITGRKIELLTPQSLSKYIGPYILKEIEYVKLAA